MHTLNLTLPSENCNIMFACYVEYLGSLSQTCNEINEEEEKNSNFSLIFLSPFTKKHSFTPAVPEACVRALLDNLALVNDGNGGCVLDSGETVGNDGPEPPARFSRFLDPRQTWLRQAGESWGP